MAGLCAAAAAGLSVLAAGRLMVLAVTTAAWLNVLLGVFSGLPGAGPDGGRIVRAVTWARTDDPARAGLVAARAGQITEAALTGPQVRDIVPRQEPRAAVLRARQTVQTFLDGDGDGLLERLRIRLASPAAWPTAGHTLVLHASGSAVGVLTPANFARASQLGALRTNRGKAAGR